MKKESEYDRFERMANHLFKVPHSDIKKKLEAEKAAKKPNKSKVSSASREGA